MTLGAIVMPVEPAGKAPIHIADPLLLALIVAVEWIIDYAGA